LGREAWEFDGDDAKWPDFWLKSGRRIDRLLVLFAGFLGRGARVNPARMIVRARQLVAGRLPVVRTARKRELFDTNAFFCGGERRGAGLSSKAVDFG
jgi:hypothetical protein